MAAKMLRMRRAGLLLAVSARNEGVGNQEGEVQGGTGGAAEVQGGTGRGGGPLCEPCADAGEGNVDHGRRFDIVYTESDVFACSRAAELEEEEEENVSVTVTTRVQKRQRGSDSDGGGTVTSMTYEMSGGQMVGIGGARRSGAVGGPHSSGKSGKGQVSSGKSGKGRVSGGKLGKGPVSKRKQPKFSAGGGATIQKAGVVVTETGERGEGACEYTFMLTDLMSASARGQIRVFMGMETASIFPQPVLDQLVNKYGVTVATTTNHAPDAVDELFMEPLALQAESIVSAKLLEDGCHVSDWTTGECDAVDEPNRGGKGKRATRFDSPPMKKHPLECYACKRLAVYVCASENCYKCTGSRRTCQGIAVIAANPEKACGTVFCEQCARGRAFVTLDVSFPGVHAKTMLRVETFAAATNVKRGGMETNPEKTTRMYVKPVFRREDVADGYNNEVIKTITENVGAISNLCNPDGFLCKTCRRAVFVSWKASQRTCHAPTQYTASQRYTIAWGLLHMRAMGTGMVFANTDLCIAIRDNLAALVPFIARGHDIQEADPLSAMVGRTQGEQAVSRAVLGRVIRVQRDIFLPYMEALLNEGVFESDIAFFYSPLPT